jgi:xanthine dehydrogenase accessory factor
MADWPQVALERLRLAEPLAMVTLLAVEGSTPRDPGARMLVWPTGQWGAIGGGNLEHQAALQARRILARRDTLAFAVQDYPLGPLLAQCCGGRVRLIIEPLAPRDAGWLAQAARLRASGREFNIRIQLDDHAVNRSIIPAPPAAPTVNGQPLRARGAKPAAGDEIVQGVEAAATRLRLFGAGHVGQAIARALEPLPFRLDWYDSRPDVAGQTGARLAPPEALRWIATEPAPFTLVLTHDHALDYALVLATLAQGCPAGGGTGVGGYLGLIGSRTKRARFTSRLRAEGLGEAALSRLVCPIGLPQITGKTPEVIALSVAADLVIRLQAMARAAAAEAAVASL